MAPSIVQSLRGRLQPLEEADLASHGDPALQLASVLLLLYPRAGNLYFPLTVRLDTLTHHPGQVSLPGGRLEATDVSGWHAALREAHEEIGLRIGRVQPLGRLTTVPTIVSNHLIVPYAGWSPVTPRLTLNPDEVTEVLEIPLQAITNRGNVHEEIWELRDRPLIVTYYELAGHQVWGATARVLSDLANRLDPVLDLGPFPPGSVRPPSV